jgi:hypothetical protein
VASFTNGGALQWTRLFGTASKDYGFSIAVDSSSGPAYVAGNTDSSLNDQASLGLSDLFVLKLH